VGRGRANNNYATINLMNLLFPVLGVAILVALVVIIWLLLKPKKSQGEGMMMIQDQLHKLTRTVDEKLEHNNREIQASVRVQLSESTKIVKEVTEGLGKLGETNRQVVGFAEQLKQLQSVLQNPKQRGVLGEYYLENVLQNVLPPDCFKMQYQFSGGEVVDAAIFVKDKIIPIDSKFSLENYNRYLKADNEADKEAVRKVFVNDLKLRIKETAKYIKPAEKTTDFAFMFIPAEGIYYDLLANKIGVGNESLIEFATREYKVIITSPASFLAYLQTVLQGLRALEIEEKATEIGKNVANLGKHIVKYEEYYKKLGNTLGTTVNHYNAGYKELGKIDKDVTRITGDNIGLNIDRIDGPPKADD